MDHRSYCMSYCCMYIHVFSLHDCFPLLILISHISCLLFPVILLYAINRAQVLLSCYMWIRYYTGYCYTVTLYTIISYSCPTDTRIHQFTECRHFICCYHRYMDTRYTVISCLHFTVTHACIVSIFLSYGSPFILHVLLLHVYSCILVT